jgi:hypothetical protein
LANETTIDFGDPIGTTWKSEIEAPINPPPGRTYNISSWLDEDNSGNLTESDILFLDPNLPSFNEYYRVTAIGHEGNKVVMEVMIGYVYYGCIILPPAPSFNGSGTLCQLQFSGLRLGNSTLKLSLNETILLDSNSTEIQYEAHGGSVWVMGTGFWEISGDFMRGDYIVADFRPAPNWLIEPYETISLFPNVSLKIVYLEIYCPGGNLTRFSVVFAVDPIKIQYLGIVVQIILESDGSLIVPRISDVGGIPAEIINQTIGGEPIDDLGGIVRQDGTYRLRIYGPYPQLILKPGETIAPPSYLALFKKQQELHPIYWDQQTFNVAIITSPSSVVSNLTFNQINSEISFNMSGAENTTGYCYITIPTTLLKGPWTVQIDNENWTFTEISNTTHSSLYFNYTYRSTLEVLIRATWVVPEFHSHIIFPLFMIATLIAAIIYRKRNQVG